MRALAVVALLVVAGCFAPKYGNGQLKCGLGAHPCPDGYYCAADKTCWQNSSKPTLDMAVASDLALADMVGTSADLPPPGIRHQGQPCAALDTCDPGTFCVDGYCCNSPCNNTCQACNVRDNLGICTNVGIGESPVGSRSCNAQASTSCGRDGKCDGQGNCRNWPAGTTCSAGTCDTSTGSFVYPSTCNGAGSCVSNGGGNCAPFKCQDATQCYQTCTSTTQCSGANICQNASCGPLANGRKCTSDTQCSSHFCVDGYCCNSTCTSNCQACDVPSSYGMCTTIGAGPPHGARTCNNVGVTPCGGACNGSSADCSYAPASMACGATCNAGQLQQSFCDGNGACAAAAPTSCANHYVCPASGSACLTSCASNSDCSPSATYGCSKGAPSTNQCKSYCRWDSNRWDDGCIYAP